MKLETSTELLERVRAKHSVSWYRLAKLMPAAENTVANWRHGRSTIDRRFVGRVAELLGESEEYVLLCLEHERETSAELRKVWKRLASLITTSRAASILPVCLALLIGLFSPAGSEASSRLEARSLVHPQTYYAHLRRRRARRPGLIGWLARLLDPGILAAA